MKRAPRFLLRLILARYQGSRARRPGTPNIWQKLNEKAKCRTGVTAVDGSDRQGPTMVPFVITEARIGRSRGGWALGVTSAGYRIVNVLLLDSWSLVVTP